MMVPKKLTTAQDWDLKWEQIFGKYQADLRHAYYVRALRRRDETRLLEIAAGSFRDMAALNRMGVKCSGADFSSESVERAKEHFPHLSNDIFEMDAFRFGFPDRAFDLTYHNGFWGLFPEGQMLALAKEQARITGKRMIATVHNAHNAQFREYFERTAQSDPLFNIRFFYKDEIQDVMSTVCRKVTVVPVGKAKKRFEDKLINMGLGQASMLKACFGMSGLRFLDQSERLLCIGEL